MFRMDDLFDCLPHQRIKANELVRGDIAYVHRRWIFVGEGKIEKRNNEQTYEISYADNRGASYLPPEHEIKIISRDAVDRAKIESILDELVKEQEKLRKLQEEEDREERRRLRAQRDELNRMLGEDEE